MYIYWDSRRVGVWVAATGGHHNDNEYKGPSSPTFLFTQSWSQPSLCCAGSPCHVRCHCSQPFCIWPSGIYYRQTVDDLCGLQRLLPLFESRAPGECILGHPGTTRHRSVPQLRPPPLIRPARSGVLGLTTQPVTAPRGRRHPSQPARLAPFLLHGHKGVGGILASSRRRRHPPPPQTTSGGGARPRELHTTDLAP